MGFRDGWLTAKRSRCCGCCGLQVRGTGGKCRSVRFRGASRVTGSGQRHAYATERHRQYTTQRAGAASTCSRSRVEASSGSCGRGRSVGVYCWCRVTAGQNLAQPITRSACSVAPHGLQPSFRRRVQRLPPTPSTTAATASTTAHGVAVRSDNPTISNRVPGAVRSARDLRDLPPPAAPRSALLYHRGIPDLPRHPL